MKIYTITDNNTGEEKNFIFKSHAAKSLGINTNRIELALLGRPYKNYTIEYRDVDINIPLEV